MRIGLFMGTTGALPTLEGQVQQAVDAERDGFDGYWIAQIAGADVLTLLALIGRQTNRIEIGTAVVPTFPRHPMMLAQQALTTHASANGRLALGIGLAHKSSVEGRWGLKFDAPALHMKQYLTVLRSLVDTGTVDYDDSLFQVSGEIQRMTAASLPIYIAALAPMMLQIAGEMADGTITWMAGRKTIETHIVPRITHAAEAAGRSAPRVCVGLPICVTDNRKTAFEAATRSFRHYQTLPSYRRMLDIEGVENPAEIAIIGNELEVETQLQSVAGAGATDFLAAMFPDDDSEHSVDRTTALLKRLVGRI